MLVAFIPTLAIVTHLPIATVRIITWERSRRKVVAEEEVVVAEEVGVQLLPRPL